MIKTVTLSFMGLFLAFCLTGCDAINDFISSTSSSSGGGLTNPQIVEGLKQALNQGVRNGVNVLSQKDGFFKNNAIKILFPEDAQKVEKTLRDIGAGALVDQAIEKLNRAAEDAAVGAKDVFVSAITQMTVNDAMGILMGEKDACTNYLDKTTRSTLYQKFQPVIKNSLNKVGAVDAWNSVITRYNQIPLVNKVNPSLDDHVTNKALDGVFHMVRNEEAKIRENPVSRTTDLMKKVFAKQDK